MSAIDVDTVTEADTGRRGRHHYVAWTVLVLVVAVIAITAWVGVRAVAAARHLNRLRADVNRVHDDLVAGRNAQADLAAARADAGAANHDTHDPVWDALGWIPPVHTVRGLSSVANDLALNVLTPIVQVAPSVEPAELRIAPDQIALGPLAAAAPTLRQASAAAQTAAADLAALPGGWFSPITAARNKALHQVTSLGGTVDDSARFATVGPAMLGANGPRRYFVGVQDNAETRATGGLVASYAIVTTDHGRVKVVKRGIDAQLLNSPTPVVSLGAEYNREFGDYHPTQEWRASNLSANFPYAAKIWASLWQKQSGEHIDGVFGVDPVALANILDAVGPVYVKGYPEMFTGANLAEFIEQGEYVKFQDSPGLRKPFVSKVAGAVLHQMLSGSGSAASIATQLGASAGGSHLQMWAARPAEEAQILGTPLAGALPQDAAPFAALAVNNITASKLDFYVHRTLTYTGTTCGAGGRRSTTITVNLLNSAPRTGLPSYVRIRSDTARGYETVSNERLSVYVYATRGALLDGTTLDGRSVLTSPGSDDDHPVFNYDITLAPGVPRTLVLHLDEPTTPGVATTKLQPLYNAQDTNLNVRNCA